jgi:hypothetical protein
VRGQFQQENLGKDLSQRRRGAKEDAEKKQLLLNCAMSEVPASVPVTDPEFSQRFKGLVRCGEVKLSAGPRKLGVPAGL